MAKRNTTPKAQKKGRKVSKGKKPAVIGLDPGKTETPTEPAFQETDLVEDQVSQPVDGKDSLAIQDFRKFMTGPRFPLIRHPKKRAALWALTKTMGLIAPAARMVKFDRSTHHEWHGKDPDYRQAFAEIREDMIDLAEEGLRKRVVGVKVLDKRMEVYELPPDVTACMAVLNNIGASRGYGNKVEVKHTGGTVLRPKCLENDAGGK